MAIPLTAIPNAPAVGAPPLRRGGGGVPGRRPIDVSGAGFDSGGIRRAQSLLAGAGASVQRSVANVARATAGNQQDLIDASGFVAEGQAWQSVAEGIQRASQTIGNFAESAMMAKDSVDMARASTVLSQYREQHKAWADTEGANSPQDWVPKWNEGQTQVQEQLEALGLSPRIKGRVEAESARFFADYAGNLAAESTRRAWIMARGDVTNAIDRAVADNDFELALQIGEENVNTGVFSEQEWGAKLIDLQGKQRQTYVDTALSADPKAVMEEMAKARESGQSEAFPWLNSAEIIRAESQAKSLFRANQVEAYEAADIAVASGEWTTPEQVRQFGEMNDLDESMIRSLTNSLSQTWSDSPAGQAKIAESRAILRAEVMAYDPEGDENLDRFYKTFDRIKQAMPPGYQEDLLDDLKTRRKEGKLNPAAAVGSAVTGEIRGMLSDGYFGTWADGKGEKKRVDTEKKLEAAQKANRLMDTFAEYHRENPKLTQAEGIEWLRKQTAADRQTQKAAEKPTENKWSWTDAIPFAPWQMYRSYKYFNPDKPAPSSEQIQQLKGDSAMNPNDTAKNIVDYEARRDASGKIAVYKLPSGDGGGSYEIAGINDRYHPKQAAKLKKMIETGRHDEAEAEAARYISEYTAPAAKKATNDGVRFALQDAAFNRGNTGAVRIMQKALGVKVDGKWGPKTQAAFDAAEADPKQLLGAFRKAREWYEVNVVGRKPGNKFWNGLVNRWNNQYRDAVAMA